MLRTILDNKHTSVAAAVLFAFGLAGILWPEWKSKFDEIAKLAIVYGLVRAGDARAEEPKNEDDKKPD